MRKIIILLLLYFYSTQAVTATNNEYSCITESVRVFPSKYDDKKFIAENLKKTYLIQVGTEEIYVKTFSNYHDDYQTIYNILRRDSEPIGISSINTKDIVSMNTFRFSEKYGEGTIVLQGTFYVNSWKLKCKK